MRSTIPRSREFVLPYCTSAIRYIINSFIEALVVYIHYQAFRFGHTLIRRFFPRLNMMYNKMSAPVDLVQNFNNAEAVYDDESGTA